MILAVVIFACPLMLGYILAEILHQKSCKKYKRDRLIVEFYEKQYWQFISIDEWLKQ